ncbi:MAG: protein-disulfide reductase DsbD family protein, partial [Gemmataceae bacterium]
PSNTFAPGETLLLTLSGTPEKNWYTYPFSMRSSDQPEAMLGKMVLEPVDHFQPFFPLFEDAGEWKQAGDEWILVHSGFFRVQQPIYLKPTAPPGKPLVLKVKLRVQVCSKTCIWEDHFLEVPINVSSQAPLEGDPQLKAVLARGPMVPNVIPIPEEMKMGGKVPSQNPDGGPAAESEPSESKKTGILAAVLAAILGGYVSLLTPCVFPMIPITVSYFLKQSEARKSGTLAMAAVYSLTLVMVLTLGGLVLLKVLVAISVHAVTNFLLAGIFFFFALSLLGMYDITLPNWLQDYTSSGEGKGGLLGVFFMALTFSIVSFACVGPIYGGFISVQAASDSTIQNYLRQILSVLGFSVAFASPFFFLALFPSLLRSMPRAGSWMNTVKVVMGFLELAAVVKFLRGAELGIPPHQSKIFTFDLALGLYVALSLACACYLFGFYRLPHDHDPVETIGVPRLLFGLGFLSLAVYLTPGLFKTSGDEAQRPRGTLFAWVESFLLPDTDSAHKSTGANAPTSANLAWHSKLPDALAEAKAKSKLVFIDFTGMLCTNCKLNERNIFTRPEVGAALREHVLLKLYTDFQPAGVDQVPTVEAASRMREELFSTVALPLYVLIRPKGDSFEIVRKDEQGLIENVPGFIDFLRKP